MYTNMYSIDRRFVPVIHDEHGAVGPEGRAMARLVCARAGHPSSALTYGMRRLSVMAARRVHAIMHTKRGAPRAPGCGRDRWREPPTPPGPGRITRPATRDPGMPSMPPALPPAHTGRV